jgi:hypothetical protein
MMNGFLAHIVVQKWHEPVALASGKKDTVYRVVYVAPITSPKVVNRGAWPIACVHLVPGWAGYVKRCWRWQVFRCGWGVTHAICRVEHRHDADCCVLGQTP